MGTLPQVLKVIFEMQRKMNNEKITRKEINFPTYRRKKILWTPPTFKPHNFFFIFIVNYLKCYRNAT
jgi:hypothetical protein